MLYREVGQYKSSYAADMAVFPILQDRIGIAVILLIAFVVFPLVGNDFVLNAVMIPFLIFALAAIGLNLLTGLYRASFARHRRLHGGRRLRLLEADDHLPASRHHRLDHSRPDFSPPPSACCSACRRCASRASISRWRRSPRNSSWNGASSASRGCTITASRARSKCRCAHLFGIPITGPTATSVTRYLIVLSIVVVMTWIASNLVHGRIGRMWMSVRDMDLAAELIGIRLLAHQAARLRGVLVLLRRGRRDDGVSLVRRGRSGRICHRSELSGAVHGDHRRAWELSSARFSAPR